MDTQRGCYAEMKIIIDNIEGRKELKKWKRKEDERERTERKQRETERGVKTIVIA